MTGAAVDITVISVNFVVKGIVVVGLVVVGLATVVLFVAGGGSGIRGIGHEGAVVNEQGKLVTVLSQIPAPPQSFSLRRFIAPLASHWTYWLSL